MLQELKMAALKTLSEKLGKKLTPSAAEAWDKTLSVAFSLIKKDLPAQQWEFLDVDERNFLSLTLFFDTGIREEIDVLLMALLTLHSENQFAAESVDGAKEFSS